MTFTPRPIDYQSLLESYLAAQTPGSCNEYHYRQAMKRLIENVPCPEQQFDADALQQWRRLELEHGLSRTAWNRYVRHLRAVFEYGIHHGLLPYFSNPFNNPALKATEKGKDRLTPQQVHKIQLFFKTLQREGAENSSPNHIHPAWFWRAVFETLHYTGISVNQLLSLRIRDIDLNNMLYYIRTGDDSAWREYSLPICDNLYYSLAALLMTADVNHFKPDDQAFNCNRFNSENPPGKQEALMNSAQIVRSFKDLSCKLGFAVSPYRLRRMAVPKQALSSDGSDAYSQLFKALTGQANPRQHGNT